MSELILGIAPRLRRESITNYPTTPKRAMDSAHYGPHPHVRGNNVTSHCARHNGLDSKQVAVGMITRASYYHMVWVRCDVPLLCPLALESSHHTTRVFGSQLSPASVEPPSPQVFPRHKEGSGRNYRIELISISRSASQKSNVCLSK